MRNGNQKKWYSFTEAADPIKVGVAAVYEPGVECPVSESERTVFTDPVGRKKVALSGRDSNGSLLFQKEFEPSYWELNIRFPRAARVGRQSESKPFQIRHTDGAFGYCYLRIQPGSAFESVYLAVDWRTYRLSVKENSSSIAVYLWLEVQLPQCLKGKKSRR